MRILEIGDTDQAAAEAGKWFACWGAEVIRLVSPSHTPARRVVEIALCVGKTRDRLDRSLRPESRLRRGSRRRGRDRLRPPATRARCDLLRHAG